MPSLNRVILIGRLTRDPELRYTSSGLAVTSFSLAVDRVRKNEQGERQTDFFRCTAWRQQAEFVHQYIHKGRLVAVEGRVEINEYTAQDGQRRTSVDIVCDSIQTLESPRDGGGEGGPARDAGGYNAPAGGAGGGAGGDEYFDDEVGAAPARSQGGAPQGAPRQPNAAPQGGARPQGQGAPRPQGGAPQGGARPQGGAPQGGAPAAAPARGAQPQPGYPQNDYDFDDSDPFADE